MWEWMGLFKLSAGAGRTDQGRGWKARLLPCCHAAIMDRYLIRHDFQLKASAKNINFEKPLRVTCDVSTPELNFFISGEVANVS